MSLSPVGENLSKDLSVISLSIVISLDSFLGGTGKLEGKLPADS